MKTEVDIFTSHANIFQSYIEVFQKNFIILD